MTDNMAIVKTKILDPEESNPYGTSTIVFCRKCMQRIRNNELDDVFKITFGMAVGDVFFPEKRTYHFHKECLGNK